MYLRFSTILLFGLLEITYGGLFVKRQSDCPRPSLISDVDPCFSPCEGDTGLTCPTGQVCCPVLQGCKICVKKRKVNLGSTKVTKNKQCPINRNQHTIPCFRDPCTPNPCKSRKTCCADYTNPSKPCGFTCI